MCASDRNGGRSPERAWGRAGNKEGDPRGRWPFAV